MSFITADKIPPPDPNRPGIWLENDYPPGTFSFYHEDAIRFEIRFQLHKLRCPGCWICCAWCLAVKDGRSQECGYHPNRVAAP